MEWIGVVVAGLALAVSCYVFARQRSVLQGADCVRCDNDWRSKQAAWEKTEAELRRQVADLKQQVDMLLSRLTDAMQRIHDLEERQAGRAPYLAAPLLVCIGPDAKLRVDLAALRKVQTDTQMGFTRLMPATFDKLRSALQRRRAAGNPIRYLHLAVHASAAGVQFDDRAVGGEELSGILAGVEVLLLAGCSADLVGDLLGVVPFVVTLREELRHDDAASLTAVFWGAIGEGLRPEYAVQRVIERCPAVAEYVEVHQ